MPCDYSKYPKNWKTVIRPDILKRAGNKCEQCGALNYTAHPVTGSKVVLTIAHIDHDTTHNDYANLRAWCQRCHNTHDVDFRKKNRAATLIEKQKESGQSTLF